MEFRTLVELPKNELEIKHSDKIMLFGSCFAENIGRLLTENKFQCDVNPFGILYNPLSIIGALEEIVHDKAYSEFDLFNYQGLYHSYMHHGIFSDSSADLCLQKINTRIKIASQEIKSVDFLFITFGTSYVYSLLQTGQIVSNCHKLPDKYFSRKRLDVDEIVSMYACCIDKIITINPGLRLLFTVSPIRHVKDGMHGNQLSKATLLLSIEKLKELYPNKVFYFPSYELMMDDLRDYRFYADDMLHPSTMSVNYIWECFCGTYFPDETISIMAEWEVIRKAMNHKPSQPESEQYKSFLKQIVLKLERLKEKYPYFDVEKEITLCHTQ